MELTDVFVRFDQFIETALKVEELPEFTLNMFAIEQTSPKDFMIMRYPYKTKAESTVELLARMGVMTSTCMSIEVYHILETNKDIRLIITNDGLQFFPFESSDTLSLYVMPTDNVIKYVDNVVKCMPHFTNPEMSPWNMEYPRVVYCTAISSNPNIGTRTVEIATVPGDIADKYHAELIRQINDPSVKVVAVPNR